VAVCERDFDQTGYWKRLFRSWGGARPALPERPWSASNRTFTALWATDQRRTTMDIMLNTVTPAEPITPKPVAVTTAITHFKQNRCHTPTWVSNEWNVEVGGYIQVLSAWLSDAPKKLSIDWVSCESTSSAIVITSTSRTLKSMLARFFCNLLKMLTCKILDS
jgi:hypothetical protein